MANTTDEVIQKMFDAVDVLIKSQKDSGDQNVKCKIIDTKNAERGEYMVDDGSRKFKVYSEITTYLIGDYVYVFTPGKDDKENRYIIGKCLTSDNLYYTYTSPTANYVDMTHDLFHGDNNEEYSLVANGSEVRELGVIKGRFSGYDRMAVSADFMTWLSTYNLVSGRYGIRLDVIYEKQETITDVVRNTKIFYFDSDEMYGNIYSYETYYNQQMMFDISDLETIISIRVNLYEKGDFIDARGTKLPASAELPNIFCRDVVISLGYDMTNFTTDRVLLEADSSLTYASSLTDKMKAEKGIINDKSLTDTQINRIITDYNTKKLSLRWIRMTDDTLEAISSENNRPSNVIIHWYQYVLEQGVVDPLAGAFWQERKDWLNLFDVYKFTPDIKLQSEQIKVIIEVLPVDSTLSYEEYSSINIDQEIDDEKITLYYDYQGAIVQYTSPILKFTNEDYAPDYATIDLVNGLSIDVDVKGNNGVYRMYDDDGYITAQAESTKRRILTARYSSLITGVNELDKAERITWIIPRANTMIVEPQKGIEFGEDEVDNVFIYDDRVEIVRYGVINSTTPGSEEADSTQQIFRIKPFFIRTATNNVITCRVVKNNKVYEAQAELFFGPHGTNGTDYSFNLQFLHNENAIKAKRGASALIRPIVLDTNGNDITYTGVFDINHIRYEWYSRYSYDADANKTAILISNEDEVIDLSDTESIKVRRIQIDTNNIAECRYHILKATISGNINFPSNYTKEDGNVSKSVQLITYLPIPIKTASNEYKYLTMSGADSIRYSSSGTSPKFYDGNYTLEDMDATGSHRTQLAVTWAMSFGQDCQDADLAKGGGAFYPQVSKDGKLTVSSLYLEGTGVQMAVEGWRNDELLWTQPLRVFLDSYGSPLLNSWDGNLTYDEKNGTILSAMVGAGKKNVDNSFSGVLMGDISKTGETHTGDLSSYYNGLGLYGYDSGVRSFGFNINGKAFLGRAGKGQILFDGTQGVIQSALFAKEKIGLNIDLDAGIIKAYGPYVQYKENEDDEFVNRQTKITIDPTVRGDESKPYFNIQAVNHTDLIYIGPKAQFLKSYDYNFSKSTGTIFDLASGILTAYGNNSSYVKLSSGKSNYNRFFEIYDGVAKQPIFVAEGAENIPPQGENTWQTKYDISSESLADDGAVTTYLNACFTTIPKPSVSEGYPKEYWGIIYRTIETEKRADKTTVEYYKIVGYHDVTEQRVYEGASKIYPVTTATKSADEYGEGDIRSSQCTVTISHTTRTQYIIRVTTTQMKQILNNDKLKNTLSAGALPNLNSYLTGGKATLKDLADECFIYLIQKPITETKIPAASFSQEEVDYNRLISNATSYEKLCQVSGITNGNYYLQSSNYDGRKNGCRLDIKTGSFITYAPDGSYVRMAGDGESYPFFSIFDNSSTATKYIFYAAKNSYFLQSSNYSTNKGCKLDITQGTFETKDEKGGGVYIKGNNPSAYFSIVGAKDDGNTNTLMTVGTTNYYLQSLDYGEENQGVHFDLKNGRLTGYSFNLKAINGASQYVQINSSDDQYPLRVEGGTSGYIRFGWDGSISTNNFSVSSEGKITATAGTIGPFTISSAALYTGTESLSGTGVYLGSAGLGVANGKFKVDSSGNLTTTGSATIGGTVTISGDCSVTGTISSGDSGYYSLGKGSATIGGWTISTTSISKNNIELNSSSGYILCGVETGTKYCKMSNDGSLVAKDADLQGKITATSGEIGGWKIGPNSIYSSDTTIYMYNNSDTDGGAYLRIGSYLKLSECSAPSDGGNASGIKVYGNGSWHQGITKTLYVARDVGLHSTDSGIGFELGQDGWDLTFVQGILVGYDYIS